MQAYLRTHISETLTISGVILLFLVVLGDSVGLQYAPALFPRIVGVFGLIVIGIVAWRFLHGENQTVSDDELLPAPPRKRIVALVSPAVYGVLFYFFGFYISAGVAIGAIPWLLGFRRPITLILLTVGTIVSLHYLFSITLNMPIPLGIVGDWFMHRFVYID